MRFSNLSYMHTNEFRESLDILISGDFDKEIEDKLDEDGTCHIRVWVNEGKVQRAEFSDGWTFGKTETLTDIEKERVIEFIREEGIFDFENGRLLKYQ